MTLAQRIDAFNQAYAKWPASHLHLVREQQRDVAYGIWVIGNNYRNKTRYYGAFPHGLLDRIMALFPDVRAPRPLNDSVLHVFSGSLPPGPYTRLDLNPALDPDVVGSVYDAPRLLAGYHWKLVIADPPYSVEDAMHYNTGMVDRRRATRALAEVTLAGGHLVWLDGCWPMHTKKQWLTVGRILIQRSTNHRSRVLSIFERVA